VRVCVWSDGGGVPEGTKKANTTSSPVTDPVLVTDTVKVRVWDGEHCVGRVTAGGGPVGAVTASLPQQQQRKRKRKR
jgi:hypothetical protein